MPKKHSKCKVSEELNSVETSELFEALIHLYIVSEELNSVETILLLLFLNNPEWFQKNLIVWKLQSGIKISTCILSFRRT